MVWAGPETLARSPYAVKLIADSSPVVTVQWCLLNVLQSSSAVFVCTCDENNSRTDNIK